jgi:large subunit ribosomal protein L6
VPIAPGVRVTELAGELHVVRAADEHAAAHGLTRAPRRNAVQGVSTGFVKDLEIVGIGYRADVKGKIANFTLGYSHPIELLLPDGVDLKIDKQTHLVLSGTTSRWSGRWRPNIRGAAQARSVQEQGRPLHGRALRKKVGKTGAERGK